MLRLITILRVRINSITTNCNDVTCLDSSRFHSEKDLALILLMHEDTIRLILRIFAF